MSKRVLLVHPPFNRLKGFKDMYFPLGLGCLSAYLHENGFHVRIYNAENPPGEMPFGWFSDNVNQTLLQISETYLSALEDDDHPVWQEVRETVSAFNPDIVGITAMTAKIGSAAKVARICKSLRSETTTVLGGPHPTVDPEHTLSLGAVDFVVRGEGEETFLDLCRALSSGKHDFRDIPGLTFQENGRPLHSPDRELLSSLDELPYPTVLGRDLSIYPERYIPEAFGHIATLRGCPFRCAFCSARCTWGRRVRTKSIARVLSEIEKIRDKHGIQDFYFWDDSFTYNRKRTLALCESLSNSGMGLSWGCTTRIDLLGEDILLAMKEAGCRAIDLGIESGSPRMLELINKGISIDKVDEVLRKVHDVGIAANAFFMIGFPDESGKDMLATAEMIDRIRADNIAFSVFTPYPGTELYDTAREYRLIPENMNWNGISHQSPENHFVRDVPQTQFRKLVHFLATMVDGKNAGDSTLRNIALEDIRFLTRCMRNGTLDFSEKDVGHPRTKELRRTGWIIQEYADEGVLLEGAVRLVKTLGVERYRHRILLLGPDGAPEQGGDSISGGVQALQDCGAQIVASASDLKRCDVVVATCWKSAMFLHGMPRGSRKVHFVLDLEPVHYPVGGRYFEAESAFRLPLTRVTQGRWLSYVLQERYGLDVESLDFAMEPDGVSGEREVEKRHQVLFYARPQKPAHCFLTGVKALEIVQREEPDVEVIAFGEEDHPQIRDRFQDRFRLVRFDEDRATVFPSAKAGLVISMTNPPWVAFSMMTHGCAVVDIDRENNRYDYPENGVLLAEPTPERIAQGILLLLRNDEKRTRQVQQAMQVLASRNPASNADRFENKTLDRWSRFGR